jgi:ABC-type multidrug transport system fused ATPase/permease subunit
MNTLPSNIYRYIWQMTGRDQIWLSVLSVLTFLLTMAPLELQRRIVNDVLRDHDGEKLVMMCLAYGGIALFMGATKRSLNIYAAKVSERTTLTLRHFVHNRARAMTLYDDNPRFDGIETAIILAEVDPVGGFVGTSISQPLLQCGILFSVFGYMVYLQPWMALVAFLLFSPQLVFVPIMQHMINTTAATRIQVMRDVGTGIVARGGRPESGTDGFTQRVDRVFQLNMRIFRLKFTMNFLMNSLYHLGVAGTLLIGGWFVLNGQTEVGTVVAFISGLAQINDPWGDLVNYFREVTTAQIKYDLIKSATEIRPA